MSSYPFVPLTLLLSNAQYVTLLLAVIVLFV